MTIDNEIVNYIITFLIMVFSSFIHSSTGFGFAVFATTLLALILPLTTGIILGRVALLVLTVMMVADLWKHINWRIISLPCITGLIGNTLGFYLLRALDPGILSRVLGAVLAVLGIYMFFFNEKISIKKSLKAGIFTGFLSGLAGGMFNLGGPVLVVYFLSAIEDKLEYASSLQATFIIYLVYINILSLIFGSFSVPGITGLIIVTVIAVIIGTWFGLKVLKKINKEVIGKLSFSYMVIMGIIMVLTH